jgi:DNA-binding winged helix-turn-helix (wHTH) protein
MASARKTRELIPGEDPELADYSAARRWLTIYEQRQVLAGQDGRVGAREAVAIAEGLAFWRRRVLELSGLEIDLERRTLNVDFDREVMLTRRELQLLEFLLQHQDRFFADHVLALRAWGDRLTGDQVRIYVRRLRAKLEGTGWELVSQRGQGYSLTRPGQPYRFKDGASRKPLSADRVALAVGRARALLIRQQEALRLASQAAAALRQTTGGG